MRLFGKSRRPKDKGQNREPALGPEGNVSPGPAAAGKTSPPAPSGRTGRVRDLNGRQRQDLKNTREIRDYIRTSGLEGQAMVDDDGNIVALKGVNRRLLHGLASMVASRLEKTGNGESAGGRSTRTRFVSPIEFSLLAESAAARENRKKSGSEQVAEVSAGNMTVDWVLDQAIEAAASDIYLDLRRGDARLSFRIYGQVAAVDTMTLEMARSVSIGLFNKSGKSKWQEISPCDTAFNHQHGDRLYRVRVNSLPDTRGQTLSCRVRDPNFVLPLDQSGYSEHQIDLIRRISRAPGGLILVTGETNSGKSTTLAGLMLNAPRGERMIEIADPVEVEMDHCTHVEINHYAEDAAEAFELVRAAIVRQNPDALVLGEIRDEPTAIAAQSMAIQGKRVYSTLHTQSCVAAIPRLQNLGVDRHLLSLPEFIAGIVNQNLVPVVCTHCGMANHPDRAVDERYRSIFGPDAALRYINPEGCGHCVNGVTGQTLVAEVYPLCLDRKDAHRIIARQELWKLEAYMKGEFAVQSKQEHAMDKVRAGLVDPDRTEAIIGEFFRTSGSGDPGTPFFHASDPDVPDISEGCPDPASPVNPGAHSSRALPSPTSA